MLISTWRALRAHSSMLLTVVPCAYCAKPKLMSQCRSVAVCFEHRIMALRAVLDRLVVSLKNAPGCPATLLPKGARPEAESDVGANAPTGTVHASASPSK